MCCCAAGAQDSRTTSQALPRTNPVPPSRDTVPFALTSSAPGKIAFQSFAQMSAQDRGLATRTQAVIARDAALADLDYRQGDWREQQITCPALPNHLILRFERNQGQGDVSLFSASIPRNGVGRVRVIPILRRSYSMFASAALNERTVAIFNKIRKEEDAQQKPDWLGVGLCYAALAGANPNTAMQIGGASGMLPILQIHADGGATIRIVDESLHQRLEQWALIFNNKGTLLKVVRSSFEPCSARTVPESTPLKFRVVPAAGPLVERPVPSSK